MESPLRLLRINGFQTTLQIKFYIRCMVWRRAGEYQILLIETFMGGKGTSLWHTNREEAEAICRIPLSRRVVEDSVVWLHNKKGEYSVRSGYHLV